MERVTFFVLTFFVIILKTEVHGLKCYSCAYVDPSEAIPNVEVHKSCKAGGKPDKSLLVECENIENYSESHSLRGDSEKHSYKCGMLTLDGKLKGDKIVKVTNRVCFKFSSTKQVPSDQSLQGDRSKVIENIKDPDLRDIFISQTKLFDDDTKATFLTCSEDGCNTGNGLMPRWSVGVFIIFAVMTHYISQTQM